MVLMSLGISGHVWADWALVEVQEVRSKQLEELTDNRWNSDLEALAQLSAPSLGFFLPLFGVKRQISFSPRAHLQRTWYTTTACINAGVLAGVVTCVHISDTVQGVPL